MGKRLTGFDYSRPMFYMVTIKCRAGGRALSEIVAPGKCQMNAITRAMVNCIRSFHLGCDVIAPIECFSIMPDHIHLLIRTAEGQLPAFTRYIRENPRRAFLREANRRYFTSVRRVNFADREWFAYGNAALLELPVIEPFRCSRKWEPDGVEWGEAVGRAERLGPGGAGCGTFMSPCEKACSNAIYQAGGALIVLSPEGFAPRWHPPRNKEALCAKGRMLFLSLWEPCAARPDNATLYRRCHEMGDVLLRAKRLGRSKALMDSAAGGGTAAAGGNRS